MGVNELVLGAPCVVGGGGIVGGVSLDCVFTSTGESGIVECFSVRSVTYHMNILFYFFKYIRLGGRRGQRMKS